MQRHPPPRSTTDDVSPALAAATVEALPARRVLTFLSVDLVESSATLAALGEGRDSTAGMTYLALLRGAIATRHGRELARRGDRLLVAFDIPSEAVTCAVAIQRAAEGHNRRHADRLDVRIGIHLGEAIESAAVSVRGDEIDEPAVEAARLCAAAQGGQILVSDLVAALARAQVPHTFEQVGLLELKGIAGPVAAFEVEWERAAGERLVLPPVLAARPRGGSPFVGRVVERERLRAAWQHAAGGGRSVAFVTGEPGIGKTRLAAEVALEAYADGATILWGRSFEESLVPFQPFAEALRHHVTSCEPGDLRLQLGHDPWPLIRLLPELAARFPDAADEGQPADGERFRSFEAVSTLLMAISREAPLVLILDDLQWADQATLLLLKYVALDPRPASLFVLGTYRDTEVTPSHALTPVMADIEKEMAIVRVELQGLAADDVAGMLGAMMGWSPPAELASSLWRDTEGNPFFLEEVIHHLEELGIAADRDRLTGGPLAVDELGVPRRVRDFVGRRLQRLSAGALEAVGTAAIMGSEFGLDVLGAVLSMETDGLVERLDEAVEARLIVEVPGRTGTYTFSHALFQQALYEGHGANRRATMHARVAAAIEAVRPDDPSTLSDLARHYARAGARYAEQVLRCSAAAGDRALAQMAYEDAVEEFQRALEAWSRAGTAAREDQADLLVRLGTAQTRAGDAAGARRSFSEAADVSQRSGCPATLARAALGYGGTAGFGGVWETFARVDDVLVGLLERALALCPEADDATRIRLLGRLAQALYWSGDTERVLALSREALERARAIGDPVCIAYALDSRHVALWGPDHVDEVRGHAEEMLSIAMDLGDRDVALEAYAWLITDALETDPIEVVDRYIDAHARVAAELHQPYHLWYTTATHAMRAHLDGRFDDMARLSRQAWQHGQQAHGANAEQTYLVQTLFLMAELGQLDGLIGQLEGYVAGSPLPAWRSALALAYAALDRHDEARAELSRFAAHGYGVVRRDCIWFATMGMLAQVVARSDAAEYAQDLYDLLLPYAAHDCPVGGAVLSIGPVSWLLGLLALTLDEPDLALRHLEAALSRSEAIGSPPLVARVKLAMAGVLLTPHAAADRAKGMRLLDEAGRIGDELGMAGLVGDVARLRERHQALTVAEASG